MAENHYICEKYPQMSKSTFTISKDKPVIAVTGKLDGQGAESLISVLSTRNSTMLDFDGVESISFAALRTLLEARRAGTRFFIINAADSVAERFEDSGVSSVISISRKPRQLDMSRYTVFGEGYMSKAYNSDDSETMLKVYGPRVPRELAAQEQAVARAVMLFGIPTPLVGKLYTDGESNALDYERITDKRSFSRIISEEPERLEEITLRFAGMCRQLHATQCDTAIFDDRAIYYRQAVMKCQEINEEEKARILEFVDGIPQETTCLHGDMQMSNIISTSRGDMWIDLAEFGYGNHLFDLGMWYFMCRLNTDQLNRHIFHFGNDTMEKIWPIFAREYFGPEMTLGEVDALVAPFAALHMLYLGTFFGFQPHMMPFIRKELLGR